MATVREIMELTEGSDPAFGWHKPSEIQRVLAQAYLAVHSLKADFDRMEEIPDYLKKSYDSVIAVAGKIGDAQKACDNLYSQMRHAYKATK